MLTSFKNLHNAKFKHKFVICDAREMSQNLGIVFLFIDDNSKKLFFLTRLSCISHKISLCSEETHPTIREVEAVGAKPI